MANKQKQRAEVYSPYWEGAIVVAAAPPGNVKSALAGAVKRASRERGCNITYFDLAPEGVTKIVWDEPVPTKAYLRDREKALRPPKPKAKPKPTRGGTPPCPVSAGFPKLKIAERCGLCGMTEPGNPCRDCGHDTTIVLA